MPVPATTGRTWWFNASDADKLWKGYPEGNGGNPADGEAVQTWDDEDAGTERLNYPSVAGQSPTWRSSGINSLGALDFDGTDDVYTGEGAGSTLSNIISASAYTLFMAFYLEGAADNIANTWENTALIRSSSFFGTFVKSNAGVHSVVAYNWDVADDNVSKTITLATPIVVMTRHEAGNLYISINQGAESSVASGNTSDLTLGILVGVASSGAVNYNGRIGELLIYNAALSGTDLTDTYQYMMDKWVNVGLTVQIPQPSVAGLTAQLV